MGAWFGGHDDVFWRLLDFWSFTATNMRSSGRTTSIFWGLYIVGVNNTLLEPSTLLFLPFDETLAVLRCAKPSLLSGGPATSNRWKLDSMPEWILL
jgi:hypothetical protein